MSKVANYRVTFPLKVTPELKQVIEDINRIFALLEDRLDRMEGVRGGKMFTTQRWERQ